MEKIVNNAYTEKPQVDKENSRHEQSRDNKAVWQTALVISLFVHAFPITTC
jgi:hypothetical protein